MAFIKNSTTFFSFAETADVQARDLRVFEANEGLTDSIVEDMLVRSSERILTQIRDTEWWRSRATETPAEAVDGLKIISRENDFTDLCVFHTMHYYLLPKVADFSDEENSERQKLDYYRDQYDKLFLEIMRYGDWYDFDNDDEIDSSDEDWYIHNNVRVR